MGCLSFIEKQIISRLFGISEGFVFKSWKDRGIYNKNTTKELILDSCGINIYKNDGYKTLSQQKCIEKIWNEENPQTVAKLLVALSQYFDFQMSPDWWTDEDRNDYRQVQEIIDRLQKGNTVNLPKKDDSKSLSILLEDIDINIQCGKPEMALDRLHTFATEYFRDVCRNHCIPIMDKKQIPYPLHSLVGNLTKWYCENNYFESDFCTVAIKNTINIFDKFNAIRNDQSAAHPNEILNKVEAEYAVNIITCTLAFIEKIENIKKNVDTIDDCEMIEFYSDMYSNELPF